MTDFSDRIEGEIKTHEKEMMRKAVILKYGSKSLIERIHYVMSTYKKDHWSEEEMFEKLTELGLNGTDSINDVKDVFSNPSYSK
jgi:3-deoxy-D-arabino-heptulosonate 7-phosphate (DAHP) synthase class II